MHLLEPVDHLSAPLKSGIDASNQSFDDEVFFGLNARALISPNLIFLLNFLYFLASAVFILVIFTDALESVSGIEGGCMSISVMGGDKGSLNGMESRLGLYIGIRGVLEVLVSTRVNEGVCARSDVCM